MYQRSTLSLSNWLGKNHLLKKMCLSLNTPLALIDSTPLADNPTTVSDNSKQLIPAFSSRFPSSNFDSFPSPDPVPRPSLKRSRSSPSLSPPFSLKHVPPSLSKSVTFSSPFDLQKTPAPSLPPSSSLTPSNPLLLFQTLFWLWICLSVQVNLF